jgi:voltage-gated potassium channel
MFKNPSSYVDILEWGVTFVFIGDYVLRWYTSDILLKKGWKSYLIYPFTFMAITDLISILPVFVTISSTFKILRLLRLYKAMRVFRVFKLMRYSKSCLMIKEAIYKQRYALISAYTLAIVYVLVAGLLVFNVEPESFNTFFDALYWAAVSLTTVGYGDIYPVTSIGRCVTIFSTFVGIAIVAIPAAIITAGYIVEIEKQQSDKNQ